LSRAPFETAAFETSIAVLLIIAGLTQLVHWGTSDIVLAVLPHWESVLFDLVTVLAGFMIIGGIMVTGRRLEMSGLLMTVAIFTSRFLLYGAYFGFLNADFAQTGVFYAAVLWAALARFRLLQRGDTFVQFKNGQVEFDD
jgi:hypothetical protein